jgi:hypothetical protein
MAYIALEVCEGKESNKDEANEHWVCEVAELLLAWLLSQEKWKSRRRRREEV